MMTSMRETLMQEMRNIMGQHPSSEVSIPENNNNVEESNAATHTRSHEGNNALETNAGTNTEGNIQVESEARNTKDNVEATPVPNSVPTSATEQRLPGSKPRRPKEDVGQCFTRKGGQGSMARNLDNEYPIEQPQKYTTRDRLIAQSKLRQSKRNN